MDGVPTGAGGGPTRRRPFRVALVTMPFGSMERPALGISLLKAGLAGRGFDCDVHHLFGDFADRIGVDDYHHGLANVRSMAVFACLYPFERTRRDRIAGYFDFDYAPGHEPSALAADTVAAVESWQRDPAPGELRVHDLGDALEIVDTRRGRAPSACRLEDVDRLVYLLCDRVSGVVGLVRRLEKLRPGERFRAGDLRALLDWLVGRELIMHEDGHYLARGVQDTFPVLEPPTEPSSPSGKVGGHPLRYMEPIR